jgi:small subunit ribosomal protein S24e
MEIKITKEQQNRLLKRKEITFEIDHSQTRGTPQRLEIRNKLAEVLKTKPELVYVKRVETKTGTMKATGEANAYESIEQAKLIEPKYIINRNIPQEKKEKTEEKAEAPAPPPKKTEKPAEKKEEPPKKSEE